MDVFISYSSLGTPEARSLRSLTARKVVERIQSEIRRTHTGSSWGDRSNPIDEFSVERVDSAASSLEWALRTAHGAVVGRDEPMASLESAWKTTLDGHRQVVVLVGDGGIGKTTLAAQLALQRHAEGALVLYGRWHQGSLTPYQAVRDALGTYASRCSNPQLRRDLQDYSDEIARLLPDVGARVGGVRPPLLGDPDERRRLFEAIEAWLERLANQRPVLLVLDDLHWAGRSSHLLVEHLRHHAGTAPLMVLLTVREGELASGDPALGQGLRAMTDVERIVLAGLEPPDVARLVEKAIGRPLGPSDGDVVGWLTRDTAGNPLFVQEVLSGVTAGPDSGAALREARQRLPDRLADIVAWRLSQLPPQTREVLADAALVGHSFELELLAEAAGVASVSLRAPLAVAVQAGLLHSQPLDDDDYVFAHEVVRRTLRDRLDDQRAAELHRRIAAAFTRRALDGREVSAVDIADHRLRGVDASTARQAVRWARHAAEAARRETAFESAVHLLTRAIEAHDDYGGEIRGPELARGTGPGEPAGSPPVRKADDSHAILACELRLELAEAHDRAGEYTARDQRHLEAAALARRLDRTDLFTRAALGLRGRLPASPPPDPTARELLEEALARQPDEDSRSRALLLARLAYIRHFDATYRERRHMSDEAVFMARRMDTPVVLATVLVWRSLALVGPDDATEDLGIGKEIVHIGERTGDPDLVLQGLRVQVTALMAMDRHEEARAKARPFVSLAQQLRHSEHLRIATMWEVLEHTLAGRYDEALVRHERDQVMAAGHPQPQLIRLLQTFPMVWLRDGGRGSVRMVDPSSLPEITPTSAWAMATWFEAITGHPERADARLAAQDPEAYLGTVRRDYLWWPTMIPLTLAASRGHQAWAAALYEVLSPYEGRNCLFGYAAFAGAVDHHLGTLAVTTGRVDDGVRHLEAALDRHRALGATPFVALSARWLSHALVLRGNQQDRHRADLLLTESVALAEEMNLHGLPKFDANPQTPTD